MMRPWALAIVLLATGTSWAGAQNSVYSILGIGFPGQGYSVRARALGGSSAAVDPGSTLNPATVALFQNTAAFVSSRGSWRSYTVGSTTASGLRETRFPSVLAGGRAGKAPFAFAFSVSEYLDRSFDITTSDTLVLRGARVGYQDRTSSVGGVSDVRAALAWNAHARLQLGVAFHALSGSTKVSNSRQFGDGSFRRFVDSVESGMSGVGFSFGASASPHRAVRIGAAVRWDDYLRTEVDSGPRGRVELPWSGVFGVQVTPRPGIQLSTGYQWTTWSDAALDLKNSAFNTWLWSGGLELGGYEARRARVPLRLGVRYGTLPFSATTTQGRELTFSAGTGVQFAGRKVAMDFTVERAHRYDGGADEHAWQIWAGARVRP